VATRRGNGRVQPTAAPPRPNASQRPAGAEEPFRALLESAPVAMVIVDQAGMIRLVNEQTEALFGYERAELLGCPVDMLVPERFRGDHPAHRRRYARNLQVRPMGAGLQASGRRRDGSEFPVEISLSPLQTSDGLLVSAAVRDVSERRAGEQRITELALIVESSPDAIFTKTLDGTITFWNAAAERMYGYTAEEAVGRHVSMLAPPGHEDEIGALLARIGHGEKIDHYETLRKTGAGDLLDVDIVVNPVRAQSGVIVGACAIVRDISAHKRAEQELTLLYQQQRYIALTLQRSLMGSPPEVRGIQTASRYLPATRGVGGDWFDLVPLGAGRTGVLIGDVMGRGLEAATVMGKLRSAANALARTGMPPQQLLDALDAVVRDLPGQLVTCCYLVINASQGEVTAGSAGHLPVLLARPDETVGRLPVPVSVPLGVGDVPHEETTLPVPHGSTLVLYTDGLVETRNSDVGIRIETLEAELRAIFTTTPGLGQAADKILDSLLPEPDAPADDVTLLLARTPAAPLDSVATTLEARPEQVATGRRFVRDILTAWNQAELADTACLLASEILTNAVRHARRPVGLRLHHMPGEIITEITDDYAQLPRRTLPALNDEFGRGLTLVEALSHEWGTLPSSIGKIVWFTLAVGEAEPASGLAAGRLVATHTTLNSGTGAGGRATGQMGDGVIFRYRASPALLLALPFALTVATAVARLLVGPGWGLVPLLAVGPAVAAAIGGAAYTLASGGLALLSCALLLICPMATAPAKRADMIGLAAVTAVTVAGIVASRGRMRRERELAEVRIVADAAQRVVLRPVPSRLGPVRLAVTYLSASSQARVGGDLYDVVHAADRVRLVVGDAEGKGLPAVQSAAALLGAFRDAAHEEASLPAIASRVETSLRRQLGDEEFVTAIFAEISADGSKVELLSCGHPAPLLLGDGQPRFLDLGDRGLPLGLGHLSAEPRIPVTVPLAPDEAVLFYTDGATEARNTAGTFFPLASCASVRPPNAYDTLVDRLRRELTHYVGHSPDDDVALLLAYPDGPNEDNARNQRPT